MKILFTGHKGTLGKELIPFLQQEHDVYFYDVNYSNIDDVQKFFCTKDFDFIIHAAIRGGRRVRVDVADDFYNNIMMFECLASQGIPIINFCSGACYGRKRDILNIDEKDFGKVIPEDYYGLSKYLISHRTRQMDHVYNLRFFNVFGPNSPKNMFTTANILNYIDRKKIVIFKERVMDFFGVLDAKKVIDLYLTKKENLPKEINLVYQKTTLLSEVAEIINSLSDYKVPIEILEGGYEKSYSASGKEISKLGLEFDGLEKSIKYCYEYLLKNEK